MEQKDKWVNEVLQSIEGIQQAEPPEDLYQKIEKQLQATQLPKVVNLQKLVWLAAAACLLIGVNIFAVTAYQTEKTTTISMYETPVINNFEVYE